MLILDDKGCSSNIWMLRRREKNGWFSCRSSCLNPDFCPADSGQEAGPVLGNYLGAKITGVDISEATIARANIRVKNNPNVRFEVGDISNLNYPPASFTKIIAIDSHYFVDDFRSFLLCLLKILTPKGKIGIFSDEGLGIEGQDERALEAHETLIGKVLYELNLKYSALNLTESNRLHWRLKEKVLSELKEEFMNEGSMFLFNNRLEECTATDRDLNCRFLFVIEKD